MQKLKKHRGLLKILLQKRRKNDVPARRLVARHIQQKDAFLELFGDVIEKVGERPGGYTRIVKLGNRYGDAAEMAILELVDFNQLTNEATTKKEKKVKAEPEVKEAEIIEEKAEKEVEPASEEEPKEEAAAEPAEEVKAETEETTETEEKSDETAEKKEEK